MCRHSQCDLHTTTNILAIPELAAKCSEPFTPAEFDPKTGKLIKKASAKCCTSDHHPRRVQDAQRQNGRLQSLNAKTVEEYMNATPSWRTDLYTAKGTLMTHAESIALFKKLGMKMTPELKEASVQDALQRRLYPGKIRPADDRRVHQSRDRSQGRLRPVLQPQ